MPAKQLQRLHAIAKFNLRAKDLFSLSVAGSSGCVLCQLLDGRHVIAVAVRHVEHIFLAILAREVIEIRESYAAELLNDLGFFNISAGSSGRLSLCDQSLY